MACDNRVKFTLGAGFGILLIGVILIVVMTGQVIAAVNSILGMEWYDGLEGVQSGTINVESTPMDWGEEGETLDFSGKYWIYAEGVPSDTKCETLNLQLMSNDDPGATTKVTYGQEYGMGVCIEEGDMLSKTEGEGYDCDPTVPEDHSCEEADAMDMCYMGCRDEGVQYIGFLDLLLPDVEYTFTSDHKVWVSVNQATKLNESMDDLEAAGAGIGNIIIGLVICVIGGTVCIVGCCIQCCCAKKEVAA